MFCHVDQRGRRSLRFLYICNKIVWNIFNILLFLFFFIFFLFLLPVIRCLPLHNLSSPPLEQKKKFFYIFFFSFPHLLVFFLFPFSFFISFQLPTPRLYPLPSPPADLLNCRHHHHRYCYKISNWLILEKTHVYKWIKSPKIWRISLQFLNQNHHESLQIPRLINPIKF